MERGWGRERGGRGGGNAGRASGGGGGKGGSRGRSGIDRRGEKRTWGGGKRNGEVEGG